MVESIGSKLVNVAAVAKVAAPTTVAAVDTPARAPVPAPVPAPVQLSGTAQALSASAPVDLDRVARIKKAIADGNFPILPSTIADQMIALRLNWIARDEA